MKILGLILVALLLPTPAHAEVRYEGLTPEQVQVLEGAQAKTRFDYDLIGQDITVTVADIPDQGWSYPDGHMVLDDSLWEGEWHRGWRKRRPGEVCPMQVFTHEMGHMIEYLYLTDDELDTIARATGYSGWPEMSEAHTWPSFYMAACTSLSLKLHPGSRARRPTEEELRVVRSVVGCAAPETSRNPLDNSRLPEDGNSPKPS